MKITKTGFYRCRNGEKVEVVDFSTLGAIGKRNYHNNEGSCIHFFRWNTSGECCDSTATWTILKDFDLISEWRELLRIECEVGFDRVNEFTTGVKVYSTSGKSLLELVGKKGKLIFEETP